jgi:hypothetical protein
MKLSVAAVFFLALVVLQSLLYAGPSCAQVKPGDVKRSPDARRARSDLSVPAPVHVAAGSTDVQSGAASVCYLPGQETPERETWYINMCSVDKNFFTT